MQIRTSLFNYLDFHLTNREIKSAKSSRKTIFPCDYLERMHFHSSYVSKKHCSKKTRHELQKLLWCNGVAPKMCTVCSASCIKASLFKKRVWIIHIYPNKRSFQEFQSSRLVLNVELVTREKLSNLSKKLDSLLHWLFNFLHGDMNNPDELLNQRYLCVQKPKEFKATP